MTFRKCLAVILGGGMVFFCTAPAMSDDLFRDSNWAGLASDRKASQVGDVLEVIVFQSAEARNSTRNSTQKTTDIGGSVGSNVLNHSGRISFGNTFSGQGDVSRSERFVTRISITIDVVLPNGDFLISGQQNMTVNGDEAVIGVRGRIRSADITRENQILSTRIANAEIDYKGMGFVARGARPGIVNSLFNLLRLGL